MASFQEKLEEYARLLVETGLNLQPGQTLNLRSDVNCAPLTRLCVRYAYERGARDVIVDWRDDAVVREFYLHADDDLFDQVYPWVKPKMDELARLEAPRLVILGSDPEALAGVDSGRIVRDQRASSAVTRPYFDAMTANRFQWCIGAYATGPWARKVFPELAEEQAVAALWDKIFAAVRVTGDGTAAEKWAAHTQKQKQMVDALNAHAFVSLHYQNALGTDFTVGLPENHYWAGGAEECTTRPGVDFIANMPTEEVFTLPHREKAEGRVYAAMPLVLNGNLVDKFWLEFKAGKIVDLHAEVGEQYLRDAIALDEGACRLGEVALVPYHSPIRDTGILFYETLFDENAACHLAFGDSYPCIRGAESKSKEELLALGANDSNTHVDFMVGTADLSITGLTPDGREIAVFRDGDFVL